MSFAQFYSRASNIDAQDSSIKIAITAIKSRLVNGTGLTDAPERRRAVADGHLNVQSCAPTPMVTMHSQPLHSAHVPSEFRR